jgi:formiminotetrahydrofolate cyclodeaminase
LIDLITLDAEVFLRLSFLYKQKGRGSQFTQALNAAIEVPMEIAELSLSALKCAVSEKNRVSKWLVSDLKEAGILLDAAVRAVRLNIEINLTDRTPKFVQATHKKIGSIQKEISLLRKIIG